MTDLIQNAHTLLRVDLDALMAEHADAPLAALDDYARQLEDYVEALNDLSDTLADTLKHLRRKQRELTDQAMAAAHSARQFTAENKPQLAQAARARQVVLQQAAATYEEEASTQNERFLQLMDLRLLLEARLTEVTQRGERIQIIMK